MADIVYFAEYADGERFSRTLLDPRNKDKGYYLGWAESIYSLYLNDATAVPYSTVNYMEEIREYGRGEQNEQKYKEYLYKNDIITSSNPINTIASIDSTQEALRKGFNDLIWDIVSYFPKIRTMIHGMAGDTDYDVFVDCVDWKSEDKKKKEKWKVWNETVNMEFLKTFKTNAGLPIDEPSYVPSSLEELNDYEATGNFRLNEARVMEKIIAEHWDRSKWDDYLKKKIVDDFIDFNFAVTKTYYDPVERKFKDKYVDPLSFVCQYSQTWEYEDSSFWGHFERRTIIDLEAKGFSREELIKIAYRYDGKYGNQTYPESRWRNLITGGADDKFWMDFRVAVFNTEWVDIDYKKTSTYTNGRGRTTVRSMAPDFETVRTPKKKKGQISDVHVQKMYKATWIVGTKAIYDYGPVNFTDRPSKSQVRSSYSPVQITGRSMTSMLRPLLDMFQLTWMKWQDAIAKAFSSGYMVNVHMLENVYDGQNDLDIQKILKIFKRHKLLLYKYSVPGNYKGGAGTPIQPVQSTLGDDMNQYIMTIDTLLRMIEDITGLNPVSLGGTPRPDQAVGTTEAAIQAASNALKPLIRSTFKIKGRSAESICRRVPLACRYSKEIYDAYVKTLGESDMELIKAGAIDDCVYAFEFKEKPKDVQVQRMLQYVQSALELGRNGAKGGIELDVAMRIESMLLRGSNLEEIRLMLSYEIKKYNERLEMSTQAAMQQQGQINSQLEAQKAQAKQTEQLTDIDGQIAVEREKGTQKKEQIILEKNRDAEKSMMELAQKEQETKV